MTQLPYEGYGTPPGDRPPQQWGAPAAPAGWGGPQAVPAWYQQQPSGPPGYGSPVGTGGVGSKPGVIPLRPLTVGEILDGAFQVVRRQPAATVGSALAANVLSLAIGVLVLLAFIFSDFDVDSIRVAIAAMTSLVAVLLSAASGALLAGVLVLPVGKAILGQRATFGQVWREALSRFWSLVGWLLVQMMVVGLILLLAVVPAVGLSLANEDAGAFLVFPVMLLAGVGIAVLFAFFAFTPSALMLERVSLRTAMVRSFTLALIGLIGFLGHTGTAMVGGAVMLVISMAVPTLLITPFMSCAVTLLYVDTRMRREGLHLELARAAG